MGIQSNDSESAFIDYRYAIGELVVRGYRVVWGSIANGAPGNGIYTEGYADCVAVGFRDGGRYVVKRLSVDDWADDNAHLRR